MVTARDVAERAGTSTAVVSYVVNNGPRNVSPATRDRVLLAAAELGYRPNALARALSHGRTASIGLVVPDIANRFFGELARALEEAAGARGNLLLIGDTGLDPVREESHIAAFVDRRVDSVVVVSLQDSPDLSALHAAGIPVVALHPVPETIGASTISIDYEAAAYAAVRHLIDHDYETIAVLNGPSESAGAQQHWQGAVRAAAESGSVVLEHLHSEFARADAAQLLLDRLARPERPRAIYCSTDEQAYGVLFACHRLGLAIPQDVAVSGFDGTEHSGYSTPPLTTVAQPIQEIADRAIEILASNTSDIPVQEIVPYTLVVRESCGVHAG
ncbi:MAG: LacI family DNA-binding transcriptional regulator [Cumulibacter sp.]